MNKREKQYLGLGVAIAILIVIAYVANLIPTGKEASSTTTTLGQGSVKEFYMESFFVMENGTPKPQFTLKEITVNKGDTIRIVINATRGTHDIKIDEYNVFKETPTGQITVVEFTSDKAGEFVYYCSKTGNRAAGQWGTLKVV